MARSMPVLLLLSFSFGCGGLDREVESFLTVSQGVYGQTTAVDDVCPSDCEPEYRSMKLKVTGTDPVRAAVEVTSNDKGFYELATEPGDFTICTAFERCIDFTVAAATTVRLDYEMSVGPGWSKP